MKTLIVTDTAAEGVKIISDADRIVLATVVEHRSPIKGLATKMAAAPDLLEALQDQIDHCFDPTCQMCGQHEQLIARARGEVRS